MVRKKVADLQAENKSLRTQLGQAEVDAKQVGEQFEAISQTLKEMKEQNADLRKSYASRVELLEQQSRALHSEQDKLSRLLKTTEQKLENVRKIADSLLSMRDKDARASVERFGSTPEPKKDEAADSGAADQPEPSPDKATSLIESADTTGIESAP